MSKLCNLGESLNFVPKISHLKSEKAGLRSLLSVGFVYITFVRLKRRAGSTDAHLYNIYSNQELDGPVLWDSPGDLGLREGHCL